jgi:hypothetical protein
MFYEIESARQRWDLRTLKRQADSCLYERLALSRDKEEVERLSSEGDKLKKIIAAGKSCARSYCREKTVKEGQNIIETWKKEDVYPYTEPAINELEHVERQIFDVVALNINEHLPDFEIFDRAIKKLSLSLVKSALERGSRELGRILEGVISLPKDRIEDLNQLLYHTTLSDIITA